MSMESFRDLVIIIYGIVGTLFMVAISIIMYFLYLKMTHLENQISNTLEEFRQGTSIIKSFLQSAAGIMGIINAIKGIFQKIGGKENEQG
jgi:hypothetical protein